MVVEDDYTVDFGRDLLDEARRSCEIEKIEMADVLERKLADCDWRVDCVWEEEGRD